MPTRHDVLIGDAREQLASLAPESVQTVVTSPPYWGLRDYGVAGQLGAERTPEEYVNNLVSVFSEMRRVLKVDGTFWVNLGDSFFGSGIRSSNPGGKTMKQATNQGSFSVGAGRAQSNGNGDKEVPGYLGCDCSSRNPYDGRTDYLCCHRFGTCLYHVCEQVRESYSRIQACMEEQSVHLPILDSSSPQQIEQSSLTILDRLQIEVHECELVLSALESTRLESSLPLLDCKTLKDVVSVFLWSLHSFVDGVRECEYKLGEALRKLGDTPDISLHYAELQQHIQYIAGYCSFLSSWIVRCEVQSKRSLLKPKDLVGIPWAVAFALRADGWFLRSDIVWNKPNVMPESVRDRPTKSHEYLFLLTKSSRYYYNQDAIREPVSPVSIARLGRAVSNQNKYVAGAPGQPVQHTMNRPRENTNSYKRIEGKAPTAFEGGDHLVAPFDVERGRNKRTVWTIPTASYRRAHFATFPEKLVEPCMLAGSRPGDTVLDPFCGSGTTLAVAKRLGRSSVGIDLNPEYLGLIMERLGERVENAES